ncbi:Ig-like domain-containing protein [Meloidogyne graminicola]|uniref:Ig-like domain-containing protein n=1 Tax=Meloidogyne graminicola TaxID=189291 RepID=A0A8T0A208_9BILA|nr:Ig-like domain-containing protein [Meloidogyne graminicola]
MILPSIFYILLLILLNIVIIFCYVNPPQWVMQLKSDRYKFNEKCMDRQKDELERFGLQPLKAIVALENSSLWLRCFECLHPDDADELEDKWKPSPSAIGRRVQKMLKFIKEKIAQSRKHKRRPTFTDELANYYWQKHIPEINEWKNATHTFDEKGRGMQEEVMDFIDRIFAKNEDKKSKFGEFRNIFIGDHYELELRKLNSVDHGGWYRCVARQKVVENEQVKTTKKPRKKKVKKLIKKLKENNKREIKDLNNKKDISQIQFIEVVKTIKIKMEYVNKSKDSCANKEANLWNCSQLPPIEKTETEINFENFLFYNKFDDFLEVYGHTTEWSQCNKCGKKNFGEIRRTVQCYIRRKPISIISISDYSEEGLDIFLLFGELPCLSSLIPSEVIENLDTELLTIFEEFTECRISCKNAGTKDLLGRNLTLEEEGKVEVVEYIEPGEFTTDERLPPLAPPIIRRTIFETEGQPLLLDCSNQDGNPINWRRNFVDLNSSYIFFNETKYSKNNEQRIQLTTNGQLIIHSIISSDVFPSGHILRTFRILYVAGDKTKDFLEKVTIVFRVILFFYLLVLMIDLLSRHAPNI